MDKEKINNVKKINSNNEWKVVEKTEHKNSNVFSVISILLVIVVILGGVAWSGMELYDLTQVPTYNKPEEVNQTTENSEDISEENNVTTTVDDQVIIEINEYVHHMTNTIIVAVDGKINGTKQITMETIEEALNMAKDMDLYLYEEINKWRNGDFNNAVEVHNYVWENLDGEIGKAESLNEEAIQTVKINLGL